MNEQLELDINLDPSRAANSIILLEKEMQKLDRTILGLRGMNDYFKGTESSASKTNKYLNDLTNSLGKYQSKLLDLQDNANITGGFDVKVLSQVASGFDSIKRGVDAVSKSLDANAKKSGDINKAVSVTTSQQNELLKRQQNLIKAVTQETITAKKILETKKDFIDEKDQSKLTKYIRTLEAYNAEVSSIRPRSITTVSTFLGKVDSIDKIATDFKKAQTYTTEFKNSLNSINTSTMYSQLQQAVGAIQLADKATLSYDKNLHNLQRTLNAKTLASGSVKEKALEELRAMKITSDGVVSSVTSARNALDASVQAYSKLLSVGKANTAQAKELLGAIDTQTKSLKNAMTSASLETAKEAKNVTLLKDELTKIDRLEWVKNIAKRTAAYYSMYQAIQGVLNLGRAELQYLAEVDTASRTFAAISEVRGDYNTKLAEGVRIEKLLIETSKRYGAELKEVNEVASSLLRAGTPVEKIQDAVEAVVLLGRLTGDTIATSASALTTYTQVYGELAADTGKASYSVVELADKLAYMANQSRMTTQDIGTFSNYALATATAVGLTVDAIDSMAISLSNIGYSPSTVGTQIRKFTNILTASSEDIKDFWLNLGVPQEELIAQISKGGDASNEAFSNIIKKFKQTSDTEFLELTRGLDVLVKQALNGLRNSADSVQKYLVGSINESVGSLKNANIVTDGYVATVTKLQTTFKDFGSSLFNNFLIGLNDTTRGILDNTEAMDKFMVMAREATVDLTKVAVGVTGVYTALQLLLGLGATLATFTGLTIALASSIIAIPLLVLGYVGVNAYSKHLEELANLEVATKKLADARQKYNDYIKKSQISPESKEALTTNTEAQLKTVADKLSTMSEIVEGIEISYKKSADSAEVFNAQAEILDATLLALSSEDYPDMLSRMSDILINPDLPDNVSRLASAVSSVGTELTKILSQDKLKEFSKTLSATTTLLQVGGFTDTSLVRTQIDNITKEIKQGKEKINSILSQTSATNKGEITGAIGSLFDAKNLKELTISFNTVDSLLRDSAKRGETVKDVTDAVTASFEGLRTVFETTAKNQKTIEETNEKLGKQRVDDVEQRILDAKREKGVSEDTLKFAIAQWEVLKKQVTNKEALEEINRKLAETEIEYNELVVKNSEDRIKNLIKEQKVQATRLQLIVEEGKARRGIAEAEAYYLGIRGDLLNAENSYLDTIDAIAINEQTRVLTKQQLIALETEYLDLEAKNVSSEILKEQKNKIDEVRNTQSKEYIKSLELTEQRLRTLRDLEVSRIKNSEDFVAGWQLANIEFIKAQKTLAEEAMEIHGKMVNSMTSAFTDFFDKNSEGFLDLGSVAKKVLKDILSEVTRVALVQPITRNLMSMFSGSSGTLGSLSALASGSSVTSSEIANIMNSGGTFDSASNAITTSGGSIIKLDSSGAGVVSKGGSDFMSLMSTISGLKTAYGVLSSGVSGSILGGFNSIAGGFDALGMTGVGNTVGQFGYGFVNPFTANTSYGAIGTGSTAGGLALGGLGGYALGSIGDKLFGADTKAGIGGALGGSLGYLLYPTGFLGIAVGSLLGSALGGIFGTKKVTDTGLNFLDTASSSNVNVEGYSDWKKKSWFSSKSGSNAIALSDTEKKAIQSVFQTYDYLLTQLGDSDKIFLTAGKYSKDTYQDAIAKSFITAFTDIPQSTNDAIYQTWKDYAESVDKTVLEALTESVGTLIQTRRTFELWTLGASVEGLAKKAQFAKEDFENLADSLGITEVTVENYLERYNQAVKDSFTADTITKWQQLGDVLMSATDAAEAYKEAVKKVQDEQYLNTLSSLNNIYSINTQILDLQVQKALVEKGITEDNLASLGAQKSAVERILAMAQSIRDRLINASTIGSAYQSVLLSAKTAFASGNYSDPSIERLGEVSSTYADILKDTSMSEAEYKYGILQIAREIESITDGGKASLDTLQSEIERISRALKQLQPSIDSQLAALIEQRSIYITQTDRQITALESLLGVNSPMLAMLKVALGSAATGAVAGSTVTGSTLTGILSTVADVYTKYGLHQYQTDTSGYEYWAKQLYRGTLSLSNLDLAIKTAAIANKQISGFSSGGYTGDGIASQVAGVVHKGEYVVNAKTTKDLGLNNSSGVFDKMSKVITGLQQELQDIKNLTVKLVSDNTKQLQVQRALLGKE